MVAVPQIIRRAKKKRSVRVSWTKDQELKYRGLVSELQTRGFVVRREELKRGHCWKAQSGVCRSLTDKLIFIDSRLSAEDQVAFLTGQIGSDVMSKAADG